MEYIYIPYSRHLSLRSRPLFKPCNYITILYVYLFKHIHTIYAWLVNYDYIYINVTIRQIGETVTQNKLQKIEIFKSFNLSVNNWIFRGMQLMSPLTHPLYFMLENGAWCCKSNGIYVKSKMWFYFKELFLIVIFFISWIKGITRAYLNP